MAGKTRRHRGPRHGGLLLRILIVALVLSAMAWRLHGLRTQVADAQVERDQYGEAVKEQRRENEALKTDMENGMTPEKVEEIARDDLGLVQKDEYVFYNTGR